VQELNANPLVNPLLQQQQNAAAAAPLGVDRPHNFTDDRNVGFCTDPKQISCNGVVRMVDRGNKGITSRCGSCKSERSHFHGRQFISNSAVNNGTFFTRFDIIGRPRASIGIHQLLNIMWTWAVDITMDKAMKLVDIDRSLSKNLLSDWRNYCREQCMWELDLATQPGPNQRLISDLPFLKEFRSTNRTFAVNVSEVRPGISKSATFSEMIAPMPAKATVISSMSRGYLEWCGTDLMVNARSTTFMFSAATEPHWNR